MSFGKIYKHHYEKFIVLFLLIIFAVLLVWQVSVTQESQNKEVDRIVSRRDGKSNYKTPYDFAGEEFQLSHIFSQDVAQVDHSRSDDLESLQTDLMLSYKLARCVFCYKLIPVGYYPKKGMTQNGKCPLCDKQLVPKKYDDIDVGDRNGNGIPDEVELRMGFDLNNPYAVEEDTDGDGFTFREEFLGKTKWDDAASHPPLAAKLSVVDIRNSKVKGLLLKRITFPEASQDSNSYEFSFNVTEGRRSKTYFARMNEPFKVGEDIYEVVAVEKPGSTDREVLQKETVVSICRNDDMKGLLKAKVNTPVDDPKETVIFMNAITGRYEQHLNGETIKLGDEELGQESFRIVAVNPVSSTVTVESEEGSPKVVFEIQKMAAPSNNRMMGGGMMNRGMMGGSGRSRQPMIPID